MRQSLDVRIMASLKRQDMVNDMLNQLGLGDDIVTWDDRPNGGDAMYNARRTWLHPTQPGTTHRLVLQDDLELCNNFVEIATMAASNFPNAIFSLYNSRFNFNDRKLKSSPYVIIPGCACYGQAILMPIDLSIELFVWVDSNLPVGYKHDDTAIGMFASNRNIPFMSTIPSTVQHLSPTESLLKYNNPKKTSKVWIGRDLSGENWSSLNFSKTRTLGNTMTADLVKAKKTKGEI